MSIDTQAPKPRLTALEFERMELDHAELVDGEILQLSPTSNRHGLIASRLHLALGGFVRQHRLGETFVAELGCTLSTYTVRAPDIAYISQGRLPPRGEADDHFYAGAPDLAVEVLSPSDRWPAVGKKVMQYLDAGAREVWVVDPKKRQIHTYAGSPPTSRIVDGDGPLTSPLLPGFALPLVELFD